MREPEHNGIVGTRATRHRPRHRRNRLLGWLLAVMVAVMVAGAFVLGTRMQPKPVAPTASEVVRTECTINTETVRVAVEALRTVANDHHKGKTTEARFDAQVAAQLPKIAEAVRGQTVSCKQAR
jgi:hypothetical protein